MKTDLEGQNESCSHKKIRFLNSALGFTQFLTLTQL